MRSVNDLEKMGKTSADPASTAEDRVLVLLESISVHLKSLEGRFELIERRLDGTEPAPWQVITRAAPAEAGPGAEPEAAAQPGAATEAEAEALTEPSSDPSFPPYALLCDGQVLLSVRALEGIDLSDRETFTGIILSEAEASDALERMADAFEEVAAYSAGWLRKKSKKLGGSQA